MMLFFVLLLFRQISEQRRYRKQYIIVKESRIPDTLTASVTMLVLVGVIVILLTAVYWYYRRNKSELPKLFYVECPLAKHILERKSRFTSPYQVPFWLQNKHLQTLLSFYMPHPKVQFTRKYIKMKDDGVIALDWVTGNDERLTGSSPILLIILMWTAMIDRASWLCQDAMDRGFRIVVFNKRGHGHSGLATPKLQSLSDCSDITECFDHIRRKYPRAPLVAHGSSAGCAVLITYLTSLGSRCPLTAAVFVCPSYNVRRTFTDMPFIYKQFLISSTKVVLWANRKILSSTMNLKSAFLSFKMKTLNTHMLCKVYGYDDVEKFHADHDPLLKVESITVPCLSISSHDDPVCQINTCRYDLFCDETNPGRMLVTTSKGGHCGFLQGLKSWSNSLSLDYLEAVLEFRQINDKHETAPPCHS